MLLIDEMLLMLLLLLLLLLVFIAVVIVVVIVVVVVVHSRNLTLKFCWNWVSYSRDIADIEFVWVVVVVGGGGGGGLKSFSCHTQLLSWVEVELGLWQNIYFKKRKCFWKDCRTENKSWLPIS